MTSWRVLLAGIVLGASLCLVTLIEVGPFSSGRIGTAGDWFAGIAAFLVLAWAVGEPRRAAEESRRQEAERVSAAAAQRALDQVIELELQPGRLVYSPTHFGQLSRTLELTAAVTANSDVRQRLRVTSVILGLARDGGLLPDDATVRGGSIALKVVDCCVDTLRAGLRGEKTLPPWGFDISPNGQPVLRDVPLTTDIGDVFRWLLSEARQLPTSYERSPQDAAAPADGGSQG